MFLVFSTSLSPSSKSFILAKVAAEAITNQGAECEVIDLRTLDLPLCDGDACYSHPLVLELTEKIGSAQGILIAAPVYNFDVSAAAKNLVELTDKAWCDKLVGFLLAAGGRSSYMSMLGLANSLMLDFRSMILPRFVYATGEAFRAETLVDEKIEQRIGELASRLVKIGTKLEEMRNE